MAAPRVYGSGRVLVHVKKVGDSIPRKAHFTESILNYFSVEGHTHEGLYADMQDGDKLVVSNEALHEGDQPIRMTRPSFCPVHHLTPDLTRQLPQEIYERGVNCGAALLLESCDGRLLLTRRAQHLHTFPGIWVPPGGHIEVGETLKEAALREFHEETGILLDDAMIEGINVLALWESVYPPKLSLGLPKRHHVVVYMHGCTKAPFTAAKLQQRLMLDPDEVGAAAWLDRDIISSIVKSDEEQSAVITREHLPQTISVTVISPDMPATVMDLQTHLLLNQAPEAGEDRERVSTGTKFALSEWIRTRCTGSK